MKWAPVAPVFMALALLAVSEESIAQQNRAGQDPSFQRLAQELVQGMNESLTRLPARNKTEAAIAYFKKTYAYAAGHKPRVAVWPFRQDLVPVDKEDADALNDKLLAGLLKASKGNFEFVARDALRAIITDLEETGALETPTDDPIAALMRRARDIDILITGNLHLERNRLQVSYKAVRMDGTIVAQTQPTHLRMNAGRVASAHGALTLDEAVRLAVRQLTNEITDMWELRLGGVRYQATGLQPDLGRFLEQRLAAGIAHEYENSLSGRKIKISESRFEPRFRGIVVEEKQLRDENFSADRQSYLLSGSYWIIDDAVELRVSLKNNDGVHARWTGRIGRESIQGLGLIPDKDFTSERETDGLGPIKIQMTSERGSDPVYRVGENLDLVLRVNSDAWVYCFYRQADGKNIQIMPNPFFLKRFTSPRFSAGTAHTIPGERIFPFSLKVSQPAGQELIKCFAASRDVTHDLPSALRGKSLDPVPAALLLDLSERFRNLPNAAVAEASLAVTVVDP